jgi:hypothetical protein
MRKLAVAAAVLSIAGIVSAQLEYPEVSRLGKNVLLL